MFVKGREFYIFYKVVIRENVEMIKMCIVYDVFVRVNDIVFFLNECLDVGFLL